MVLPNFLIIGAAKAGTTTLHYTLEQHPQVFMCPVKEAGFFWAYGQEIELKGPGSTKLKNRLVNDWENYQRLFESVADQKAIGEASVRYLYMPQAPNLIRTYIPDARLIAILRQPAERAFSAFMHNIRDGLEPCQDFREAIAQDRDGHRDGWMFCRYLDRGYYAQQLRRYFENFDRSQMLILLFDDLKKDTKGLVQNVFQFLEVEPSLNMDHSQQHNVSGIIRNPFLRTIWTKTNTLRSTLRPLMNDQLRHRISERFYRDVQKMSLDPAMRAELTAYYRDDILQLQDLIQRDLSAWLEPSD